MLLLILFCSATVYAIPAFNKNEFIKEQKLRSISYVKRTLGECDAANMNPSTYESLGIPEKDYKLDEHYISVLVNGSDVHHILQDYTIFTGGSVRDRVLIAKKEHPELEDEIEYFIAFSAKLTLVHLKSVLYQLRYKKEGIFYGRYEVPVQRNEAFVVLNNYEKQLVQLIDNFGSETAANLQSLISILNKSKVLNLDCDFKCMRELSEEWMKNCAKENDSTATEAPEGYPVAEQ